ncbi:hypothetical protein [Enterococcus alishanensis]|uniref:Uncharacterized protein n=1 Tax=Enterococcus alishanensis TaxID=1303817 RepID=A0ABS6TH79_9ENTE|nr:hypothetical protein [Enterococcus alishanensis]MBV7392285.1 hypothetical protein [Enterococcus alishanensis]
MSTNTKIGLSILTLTGTYAMANFSKKTLKRIEREVTRRKTKKIVKNTFNNNKKFLDISDDLSDSELDALNQFFKKVGTEK